MQKIKQIRYHKQNTVRICKVRLCSYSLHKFSLSFGRQGEVGWQCMLFTKNSILKFIPLQPSWHPCERVQCCHHWWDIYISDFLKNYCFAPYSIYMYICICICNVRLYLYSLHKFSLSLGWQGEVVWQCMLFTNNLVLNFIPLQPSWHPCERVQCCHHWWDIYQIS